MYIREGVAQVDWTQKKSIEFKILPKTRGFFVVEA